MDSSPAIRDASAVDELSLLHQPSLVEYRWGSTEDSSSSSASVHRENLAGQPRQSPQVFVGMLEKFPAGFQQKAIAQWTDELKALLCRGESEFINVLVKRSLTQMEAHVQALATQQRRKKLKTRPIQKQDTHDDSVPAILRLAVLSMFPLIEALANIPGANFDKLCSSTLDTVIKTLATLSPLALTREPADCLDAFKNFVSKQVANSNYSIDTPAKAQAAIALLALVLSQGKAPHVFYLLNTLFTINQNSLSSSTPLSVGQFVKNIVEYNRESDVPVPCEHLEEPWTIELLNPNAKPFANLPPAIRQSSDHTWFVNESQTMTSLATDGKYLYIHSPRGLVKVGNGLKDTIKAHIYAENNIWRNADKWTSLACIGDKLYFWSPDLSTQISCPKAEAPASDASVPAQPAPPNLPSNAPPSSNNAQPAAQPRPHHIIAIICTETLALQGYIRVNDSNLGLQSRMITDGKHLIFVGRLRGKAVKSNPNPIPPSAISMGTTGLIGAGSSIFGSGAFTSSNPGSLFGDANAHPPDFNGFSYSDFQHAPPGQPPSFSLHPTTSSFSGIISSSMSDPPASQYTYEDIQKKLMPQEEDETSDSSITDEEDSNEEEEQDDGEGEDEYDDQLDEVGEEDDEEKQQQEQLQQLQQQLQQQQRDRSPRRRTKSEKKEKEEDSPNDVICAEWYDPSNITPISQDSLKNLSSSKIIEVVPALALLRTLEMPCQRPQQTSYPTPTPSMEEILPQNFANSTWYCNGHYLVALVRPSTPYFRLFSTIDGKLQSDLNGFNASIAGKELDPRDNICYDIHSNSIWSYRYDSCKVSRWHHMGLAPHFASELDSSMQVDITSSSSSKSPSTPMYRHPGIHPLAPESILQKLDIWTGSSKKVRPVGAPKASYVIQPLERQLKDNLTPLEIICTIAASLDRLARHNKAYHSSSIVDESHGSTTTTYFGTFMPTLASPCHHFVIDASPQTLQHLLDVLHQALNFSSSQKPSDNISYTVLVFVRLIKMNMYHMLTYGKASALKDEEFKPLISELSNVLLTLTNTQGMNSYPAFSFSTPINDQIQSEACNAICVGFFIFYSTPTEQIQFVGNLTQLSHQAHASSLLHERLMGALSSYYRIHEMLIDDPKSSTSMDIDPSDSRPKRPASSLQTSFSTKKPDIASSLGASSSVKSDRLEMRAVGLAKEYPFHPQTIELVSLLLKKSLDDTLSELKEVEAASSSSALRIGYYAKPTLRLLMALQMEILCLTFSKSLVVEYFSTVAQIITEFLNSLSSRHLDILNFEAPSQSSTTKQETSVEVLRCKAFNVVLESSAVGSLLPSLLNGLCRKIHVKDPVFITGTFDRLCTFLEALDSFNQKLRPSLKADAEASQIALDTDTDSHSKRNGEISYWLLDVETTVALLARKCVLTLLEGETISEKERQCQDWLDTRLLNGGMDDSLTSVDKVKWLELFAEGKEGAALYTWLQKQGGSRPALRPTAKASLERAERYVLAAMMKHSGLVNDAQEFAKLLVEGQQPSAGFVARFSFLAKRSTPFASLLTRRAEMQKFWQNLVQDRANDMTAFGDLAQSPEKLVDFCEMHGVEANLVNTEETIKRLLQKLQEEIAASDVMKKSGASESPHNIYEVLCAPIVERAIFLMKLLPSNRTIRHPAADASNPFERKKKDSSRLRRSAPGSSEGGPRANLIKSTSLLPTTESAQEKQKEKESEDVISQAFTERVGELRSWLNAYTTWEQSSLLHGRQKKDEPPPASPLQGVVAFTTNHSVTVKDWDRILRVQATRAKSREQGLQHLKKLISICRFGAPRHQILGSFSVSHYLDGIQSCGEALTRKVTELFGNLFIALTALLKDTSLDPTSRLLALNICTFSYTEYDAPLMTQAGIFPLLQEIMASSTNIPGVPSLNTTPEARKAQARNQLLSDAAWTCFRRFAAQVVAWLHHDELGFERAVITNLQQQAFDVFLKQLKTFSTCLGSHDLDISSRELLSILPQRTPYSDKDFAFELVFLLRLLSETSKAWSSPDSIPPLLKFLSSRTAPRAQRVVLRMLRKLLPTNTADRSSKSLVQFCLEELGKWIFQGKCNPSASTTSLNSSTSGAHMDSKTNMTDNSEELLTYFSLIGLPTQMDPSELFTSLEIENASLPKRMKGEPKTSFATGPKKPKSVTLTSAAKLAKAGAIVQVSGAANVNSSSGSNGENNKIAHLNPAYWTDGDSASMIASEYIALLRYLFSPSQSLWFSTVESTLVDSIKSLPSLADSLSSSGTTALDAETTKKLFSTLSALCVISGFQEPIRVGGRVIVKSQSLGVSDYTTGTVVAYAPSTSTLVSVVLDSDSQESKTIHSLEAKQLLAMPEFNIEVAQLVNHFESIVPALLSVITTTSPLDTIPPLEKPQADSASQAAVSSSVTPSSSMEVDPPQSDSQSHQAEAAPSPSLQQNIWLFQELKSKSLSTLNCILQHPAAVQYLMTHCNQHIPFLLRMAQKADPSGDKDRLKQQLVSLSSRLWDLQTIPDSLEGRRRRHKKSDSHGLVDMLPYYWNAFRSSSLPTGFDKSSFAPGTIILDDDATNVQLHFLKPSSNGHSVYAGSRRGARFGSSGRDANQNQSVTDVIFMFGNCLVPSKGLGEYYFEVIILPDTETEKPTGALSKPNISIGLVPDPQAGGPTTSSYTSYRRGSSGDSSIPFPSGSYCYLSNRSKAWVVDNNLRTEGYGEHFGHGTTVGCLWNQVEKTISFTKDGEELDIAFRNVLSSPDGNAIVDKLVPCVSSTRGVSMVINFGQLPFKYTPECSDTLDAAAREQKRKEAEEKRQKAIQEERNKRKAEHEAREAIFNEDATLLLSMGFTPKHALKAMQHAGWTYKNRWPMQEGVVIAASWLTDASPDQLGPAGDLPSEFDPPPEAPKLSTASASSSKKKSLDVADKKPDIPTQGKWNKPEYPETNYGHSKVIEYVLGDGYSMGVPNKNQMTPGQKWCRDIAPLVTKDIGYQQGDQVISTLCAYAEAGSEDALKSLLNDLYRGKIPSSIKMPSQLKMTENIPPALKMTQITPEMTVVVNHLPSSNNLRNFNGRAGSVLARDLKQNLVLVQFVNSEDGTLEEWWFPIIYLAKHRAPTRPFSHIHDAKLLQNMLARSTQQNDYFAARGILLSILCHAPLSFNPSQASKALENAAAERFAARSDSMDIDSPNPSKDCSASSSSISAESNLEGAIDVQDAISLLAGEHLASPETIINSGSLYIDHPALDSDLFGMDLTRAKLLELIGRSYDRMGLGAVRTLLESLLQKCVSLIDESARFSLTNTVTFTHYDSPSSYSSASTPAIPSKKSGSSSSSKEGTSAPAVPSSSEVLKSFPNYLHRINIPGARACVVIIHSDTATSSRMNVYLDEDCTDLVSSLGGISEVDHIFGPEYNPLDVKYTSGGAYQPILVPSNYFYVKGTPSAAALAASASYGYGSSSSAKVNLEYKVTVVPVTSDLSLGRWLAEFLTFATIPASSPIITSIDFNLLLDTLIDYLYLSVVPTPFKESVIALLARIIHDLRIRLRSEDTKLCKVHSPAANPQDGPQAINLQRLNTLKREMTSLYDNERRASNNNEGVKKRASQFSTYLHSLIELMVSSKLYDNERALKIKLIKASTVTSFSSGIPDTIMNAAVSLAQSITSETSKLTPGPDKPKRSEDESEILGASYSLFDEDETAKSKPAEVPNTPSAVPSTSDSKVSAAPEPSKAEAHSDDETFSLFGTEPSKAEPQLNDVYKWEEDLDEDFAQALALSVQDSVPYLADPVPSNDVPSNEPKQDAVSDSKKEQSSGSDKPKENLSMTIDIPPPPPPPGGAAKTPAKSTSSASSSPAPSTSKTPGAPSKKGPPASPAVSDPAWFTSLVSAAQVLQSFSEPLPKTSENGMQVDGGAHPAAVPIQFIKDLITNAYNNIKSADWVRNKMFLIDNVPTVTADKRVELATVLEELVEEKTLVVEGTFYLPVDYQSGMTKNWLMVEVQSSDNMPSSLTFKDPNFTKNKPVKLEVVPVRRLIEKAKSSSSSSSSSSTSQTKSKDSDSTTATGSTPKPETPIPSPSGPSSTPDLYLTEPEPEAGSPEAGFDPRWREFVRSRLWDKKTQTMTREFREALTETFIRFSNDHTVNGVLGVEQFAKLQTTVGGEPLPQEAVDQFFSLGTKKVKYNPKSIHFHSGKSPFWQQYQSKKAHEPSDANTMDISHPEASSSATSSSSTGEGSVELEGLTLDAFLTIYTNQALQEPLYTFEELKQLGYDLHLNRVNFSSLEEAENAILTNDFITPKCDLELIRYVEQLLSELDIGSPLHLTVSHIRPVSMESHLAQIYQRLVRLSMPALCLRYEMLRQLNQKIPDTFALINLGSRGQLAQWLRRCRGLLFHALKINYLHTILERSADDSSPCPSVVLNRIDISAAKDHVMATRTMDAFVKSTAFGAAYSQLQHTDPASFRRSKPGGAEPHFAMRVVFEKENVQGDGGPYRQFFTDISKELAEVLPLLVPCPNAQTKVGNNRDKFVVAPSSSTAAHLRMFRFLGQLMGMSIRTGAMFSIDLPSFFWKPLVGVQPHINDIRDIDHSFYTVIKYLESGGPEIFEGESRTMFDHFVITLSDKSKTLLKPDGDEIEVTYDNRDEWCKLAEHIRIKESDLQLLEIRRGLAEVVPLPLLNIFTWQDLQWRVCGRPQIDLKLLKRHTEYAEGISATSPHIRYFWQILRSFSQEDRRAFVRFAWAQERLPADDQAWARANTRMMIKQGPASDMVFPTADTCFFNLTLPIYSSPEIMKERLLFAIHTDGAMDNDRPNMDHVD